MDDKKVQDTRLRHGAEEAIGRTLTMSPEMFEKLYLAPKSEVAGQLRKTFGNPTPLGLLGIILSLGPLSCDAMGWRGAGGGGASNTPAYIFNGGLFMFTAGILEFFLGNTFSFVVFCGFGGWWFTLGTTNVPSFNAYGAYSQDPSNPAAGLESVGFNSGLAFWLLFLALFALLCTVCAMRTNVCVVLINLFFTLNYAINAAAHWYTAEGSAAVAHRLSVAGGACGLVAVASAGWLMTALLLESVDFPVSMPVGDLTKVIRGSRSKAEEGLELS